MSTTERLLLPKSQLLGKVEIKLKISQLVTTRSINSMMYLFWIASDLHLKITLRDHKKGYEHQSDAANFIEKILLTA